MDEEILDRLMIDRAVGALDPDVEALLADYLKQAGISEEEPSLTCEVVRLSRNLLKTEEGAVLPRFRISQLVRKRHRRWVVLQTASVAAMLMIVFLMGRRHVVDNGPVPMRPVVTSVVTDPSTSGSGIWSINRFRKLSPSYRSSSRWNWTSSVRQPEPVSPGELL
jgi:hypothetical protein